MPNFIGDDTPPTRPPLTPRQVLTTTAATGAIGLGFLSLGLAGIVSAGMLGANSGSGIRAMVIGLGCVILMILSALALGLGVLCLLFSVAKFQVK